MALGWSPGYCSGVVIAGSSQRRLDGYCTSVSSDDCPQILTSIWISGFALAPEGKSACLRRNRDQISYLIRCTLDLPNPACIVLDRSSKKVIGLVCSLGRMSESHAKTGCPYTNRQRSLFDRAAAGLTPTASRLVRGG